MEVYSVSLAGGGGRGMGRKGIKMEELKIASERKKLSIALHVHQNGRKSAKKKNGRKQYVIRTGNEVMKHVSWEGKPCRAAGRHVCLFVCFNLEKPFFSIQLAEKAVFVERKNRTN